MRIFPLGENAVTVEFGDVISHDLNAKAIALAEYFETHPFPGYIESVPAYATTTVFFDLVKVRDSNPESATAFDGLKKLIETSIGRIESTQAPGRFVEIPCSFTRDDGLDLDEMSETLEIAPNEIIKIFVSRPYRVYMLGFLPGFAYMGEVDERIAVPRRKSPRAHVPKGSVGIAGRQVGIYPLESPGGWQIIGRTDAKMFDHLAEQPCLLAPGDAVKFVCV